MNINDLVVGRLYKVNSKKSLIGPEKEESLCMFLRVRKKKLLMLSLEGDFRVVDFENIETPRSDYLEIFNQEVKDNVFPLMRKFILEYQKYDNIKYSKKKGFTSSGLMLRQLNYIQKEIERGRVTPSISRAVDNYFNFYKKHKIDFNAIENTMINFLFINEWKDSHKKLRGFSFNSNRYAGVNLNGFSQDTLILQHLYTNLCLKPNLNNIKSEWIDLLIIKIHYNGYKDKNKPEVIKFLSKIKEECENNISPIQVKSIKENTPKLNTISFSNLMEQNQI